MLIDHMLEEKKRTLLGYKGTLIRMSQTLQIRPTANSLWSRNPWLSVVPISMRKSCAKHTPHAHLCHFAGALPCPAEHAAAAAAALPPPPSRATGTGRAKSCGCWLPACLGWHMNTSRGGGFCVRLLLQLECAQHAQHSSQLSGSSSSTSSCTAPPERELMKSACNCVWSGDFVAIAKRIFFVARSCSPIHSHLCLVTHARRSAKSMCGEWEVG